MRLRLLGRLALTGEDGLPVRLVTRKCGALLAYLATCPEQSASREQLATLLWGGCADAQARQSLRQALVLLRKELNAGELFEADKTHVRLTPGAWSIDLAAFEALARSAEPQLLAQAGALFSGAFLQDFHLDEESFTEWLREQRNRVERAAARLCETFATRPELVQDGETATATAERLLALDPLREDWQRIVLRLTARYRGRCEALAQAEACAALLQRELGVLPEKETRALIEEIRAAPEPVVAAARPEAPAPPSFAPAAQAPAAPTPSRPVRIASPPMFAAALAGAAVLLVAVTASLIRNEAIPTPLGAPAQASVPPDAKLAITDAPSRTVPNQAAPKVSSGVATILVLPFTVTAPSQRASLLAERMSDDLTHSLSRVGGFRIISRQTALTFREEPIDPAAISAQLGVRYLLQGDVDAGDNRLRANIELIDAKGARIWSGRFDRGGNDLPAIVDEIVKGVGRELQVEISAVEGSRETGDQDLHAKIYKGWAAMAEARRIGTPAIMQAQRLFADVLEREPNNTRAMTGLGAAHAVLAQQLNTEDREAHLAQAEALLKQVVERRPDVGGPSMYLAMVANARGRTDEAIGWLERELKINPSQAGAYAQLGRTFAASGRTEEGLERILYAMRLSPRDTAMPTWLAFAGSAELELKHYDRAISYLERSLALGPAQDRVRLLLAAAHALAGHGESAQSLLRQAQAAQPKLSRDKLIARAFSDADPNHWPQLREGVRLMLAQAGDPWRSPGDARADVTAKGIIPLLVLPFTASGEGAADARLLAAMITDDLTNVLSRAPTFRVISRQTARRLMAQPIDIAALGAELQVRYVLEGSLRLQDGRLRVNVELIDPTTRLSVWTGRVDRTDTERRGIEDEIVARLAREMQFEILPIESKRRAADDDVDALVYRGWATLSEPNQDGYERARLLFEDALARDPDNLSATIGLGAYHARMGAQVYDTDARGHRVKAEHILREAVRRDPRSSDAEFYLGLSLNLLPTLPEALQHFARAIALDPSNASAHGQIGNGLIRSGQLHEGLAHVRYAMRLSPRDPIMPIWLEFAGNAELELRNYPAAIALFTRSTELNSDYPRSWAGLVAAHALAGNREEAQRYAERLKSFAPMLSADGLVKQYGRQDTSRLHEGLRMAFVSPEHAQ